MNSTQELNCQYVGECGGCPQGLRRNAELVSEKQASMRALCPTAEVVFRQATQLRDRVDLIWQNIDGAPHLGLYGLGSRNVVDLANCAMLTPALEHWVKELRSVPPPIQKGSVRLRVSPSGERGVWLDFSNLDVKHLFTEQKYLRWLSAHAFVEIGQRRKALVFINDQPKLTDPILKPWFETYDAELNSIPLFGPVGGFSQVGFKANRALVQAVCELVTESAVQNWVEMFCGNGNFALALAARGKQVLALELEPLAIQGLQQSMAAAGLQNQVQAECADVYLKTPSLEWPSDRGLLVDPPRAGLRELLKMIEAQPQLKTLIYVSCFSETFHSDTEKLKSFGFDLRRMLGIDQFSYSDHMEWVALFSR